MKYNAVTVTQLNQYIKDRFEEDENLNAILVKGNGNYKIPLVYEGDELAKVPDIKLENIVNKFKEIGI